MLPGTIAGSRPTLVTLATLREARKKMGPRHGRSRDHSPQYRTVFSSARARERSFKATTNCSAVAAGPGRGGQRPLFAGRKPPAATSSVEPAHRLFNRPSCARRLRYRTSRLMGDAGLASEQSWRHRARALVATIDAKGRRRQRHSTRWSIDPDQHDNSCSAYFPRVAMEDI